MADSKIMMNIKGIFGSFIPRFFFQRKLDSIFQEILSLDSRDLEAVRKRVNYYNKISSVFEEILKTCKDVEILGKLPFKKTSLAYDGYAISKYFSDDLRWIKRYGDINYFLPEPAVCKDRPIGNKWEDNQNNVLLKLDKNRHFIFLKDTQKFKDKKNRIIFRGACYQELRKRFMDRHFLTKNCDAGDTARNADKWKKAPVNKTIQIENKYILSLEGNTFASNLIWAMSSNSLVIAPKMKNETWLMEGTLRPNEHFALLNDDFENLEELIEYYNSHPNQAQEIIDNAHSYLADFQDERKEFLIAILVLAKYLFFSNQVDLPKEIVEIFS